jgi:broad specificity phosphatase PhoE
LETRIYRVRHGAVAGAATRRFIGHLDVALSASGERHVQALARRLSSVALGAIYASDLVRTRHTAEILAAPHGLVPRLLPDLREFAMGRWEGLTAAEIREREPEAFATWMADVAGYRFPDGESLADLASRAWPAFSAIVEAHAGQAVAVVAHGGTNRMILCRALGLPASRLLALGQDHGGLTLLAHEGGRWTLRVLNQAEAGP